VLDESELEELAAKVDNLRGLGKMSNLKALRKVIDEIPNLTRKEREEAHDELSTYLLKRPTKNILNLPVRRAGRDRGAMQIVMARTPEGRTMLVGGRRRDGLIGHERAIPNGDRD
jgi:hypothetical protein